VATDATFPPNFKIREDNKYPASANSLRTVAHGWRNGAPWTPPTERTHPTPTTQDAANNGDPSQSERNTPPLNAIVGGLLNPDWVEWLMGWPIGWTDLERDDVAVPDWSAEPDDAPRVTTRKDRRVPRLKALGNGQVPQCAALAWRTLLR
jgi:hypothetical protein